MLHTFKKCDGTAAYLLLVQKRKQPWQNTSKKSEIYRDGRIGHWVEQSHGEFQQNIAAKPRVRTRFQTDIRCQALHIVETR